MKRSPRQQRRPNGFPKTTLKDYRNQVSNDINQDIQHQTWIPPSSTTERENQSPSTTDSSPWDEKPKAPIPTPRKKQSDGCPVILRKIERDSLNSYAGEDDYGEYEEDEDEIFDEIIDESPATSRPRADYVNLSNFCVVKDSGHVYSDIVKIAPEIPKHQPLIQFEQKLFRTAEKCLSVIGDDPSTSGEQSLQFLSAKFLRTSDNSRRHPSSSAGSLPSRESNPDSGLGRCSSERVASNGSTKLPEKLPDCMVLAHPPRQQETAAATTSSCSRLSTASDYAIPPHEENRLGTMRHQRQHQDIGRSPLALRASIVPQNDAEMNGYLVAMSDNRLKSLKRRYVVLKNSEMKFYRTQKHLVRDENPTMTIKLRDVKNISKVSSKSGGNGFEVSCFFVVWLL
uniref:PH domain-containing protein n=1 Tax=Panagrolaimus superbus TaxID=310955 RepID=A0A914YXP5_9BILA